MPISTVENAFKNFGGINQESNKILSSINGQRTVEEMIWEYFGLRKEVIYSDDGQSVDGMINEFIDHDVLQKKKVRYVPYFESKGMTKEMYDKVIPTSYQYQEPLEDNQNKDEQNTSTRKPKRKS